MVDVTEMLIECVIALSLSPDLLKVRVDVIYWHFYVVFWHFLALFCCFLSLFEHFFLTFFYSFFVTFHHFLLLFTHFYSFLLIFTHFYSLFSPISPSSNTFLAWQLSLTFAFFTFPSFSLVAFHQVSLKRNLVIFINNSLHLQTHSTCTFIIIWYCIVLHILLCYMYYCVIYMLLCSLYVYYMLLWLFIIIHCPSVFMFIICSLYVIYMFIICSLYVHYNYFLCYYNSLLSYIVSYHTYLLTFLLFPISPDELRALALHLMIELHLPPITPDSAPDSHPQLGVNSYYGYDAHLAIYRKYFVPSLYDGLVLRDAKFRALVHSYNQSGEQSPPGCEYGWIWGNMREYGGKWCFFGAFLVEFGAFWHFLALFVTFWVIFFFSFLSLFVSFLSLFYHFFLFFSSLSFSFSLSFHLF